MNDHQSIEPNSEAEYVLDQEPHTVLYYALHSRLWYHTRRIGRTVMFYIIVSLLSVSVLGFTILHISFMRDIVRSAIMQALAGHVQAHIQFSDFGGNVLTGIVFDNIRVITGSDTVVHIPHLTLRYDIEPLFRKTIAINALLIESPVIHLLRNRDSSWNFSRIALTDTDSTPSKPFDWHVIVRECSIDYGTLIVYDSLASHSEKHLSASLHTQQTQGLHGSPLPASIRRLNTADISIQRLMLGVSASLDFGAKNFSASLYRLAFYEERTDFTVKNVRFSAAVNRKFVEVFDVELQTARSSLRMNALTENVNLPDSAKYVQWRYRPVKLNITADSISMRDLQTFTPALDMFGSAPSLHIAAEGTPDNLRVSALRIGLDRSDKVMLSARFRNLHDIDNVSMEGGLQTAELTQYDIQRLLPHTSLPNLHGVGGLTIVSSTFSGTPTFITASLMARSHAGSVTVDAILDRRTVPLRYDIHCTTNGVNLGAILADETLKGSINASVAIQGEGTTLQTMNTRIGLRAQSTNIGERFIRTLTLDGSVRDGGIIRVDTLVATFQPDSVMNPIRLTGKEIDDNPFALYEEKSEQTIPELRLRGLLDMRLLSSPRYDAELTMRALNVESLIPGAGLRTAITGTLSAQGSGMHLDSIETKIFADFQELRTSTRNYGAQLVSAQLVRRGSNERDITIATNGADISIAGTYRIPTLIRLIGLQVNSIERLVGQRLAKVDPDYIFTDWGAQSGVKDLLALPPEKIDAAITLNVSDLSPFFLGVEKVYVQADAGVFARISGTTHAFRTKIDSSELRLFKFRDRYTSLSLPHVKISALSENILHDSVMDIRQLRVASHSDTIVNFDGTRLLKPMLSGLYVNNPAEAPSQQDNLTIACSMNINENFSLALRGSLAMKQSPFVMNLDSLTFGYLQHRWRNQGQVKALISDGNIEAQQFAMQRRQGRIIRETVRALGLFSPTTFSNFTLSVQNYPLAQMNAFLKPVDRLEVLEPLAGTVRTLNITLNGNTTNPVMQCDMRIDSLQYGGGLVGNLSMERTTHKDGIIRGDVVIVAPTKNSSAPPPKVLTINCRSLPLNLSFKAVRERLQTERPIDITFTANNLQLAAVQPFLPGVEQVRGYGNANFTISGPTTDNITYRGTAEYHSASFVVQSTAIKYFSKGNFSLLNNDVRIDSVTIANDQLDYRSGRGTATGRIKLKGLSIDSVDVTLRTPALFVLSKSSKTVSPTLYGDMVIASDGDRPLRFFGTLQNPYLRGDVSVLNAYIFFPEDKSLKGIQRTFCFETVRKDKDKMLITERDCARNAYTVMTPFLTSSAASIAPRQQGDGADAQEEEQVKVIGTPFKFKERKSFADIIDYDLNVRIRGRFTVLMDFGTFEQLVADVEQENIERPLRYVKTPDAPLNHKLFGDVRVLPNSTYNFYRSFKANGTMAFTTGAIDNPRLQLSAELRARRTTADRNSVEEYVVNMDITGTKKVPIVKISYMIADRAGIGDSTKIQTDAIMLMLFGKTQDELLIQRSPSGGVGISTGDIATQGGSSAASTILTEILQSVGTIRSADIIFDNNNRGAARVQLSGEIFGVGVQYASDLDVGNLNPSFTIDLPLGAFFDVNALRNLVVQFTRSANISNTNVSRQQREWELKFGWRTSF